MQTFFWENLKNEWIKLEKRKKLCYNFLTNER